MKMVFLAATGGALGAAGRYLVGVGATHFLGLNFPWGTLIVNVVGSFLMGVLASFLALRFSGGEPLRVFLAVGVFGGFTTFSAFSLDFVSLMERKAHGLAALYLGGSVVLSIVALVAGLYLARAGLR